MVVCLPFLTLYLIVGPGHDFIGLWNTVYSSRYSVERYQQVHIGMPRNTVIDLLGEPLKTYTLTDYPASALRDEGTRRQYSNGAPLQLETLYFSRARNNRGDFDLVSVWFGPDNKVIQCERWVTD